MIHAQRSFLTDLTRDLLIDGCGEIAIGPHQLLVESPKDFLLSD